MSLHQPIFCCDSAVPVIARNNIKLHRDPNRGIHNAIYQSFLAFARRRERAESLMELITGAKAEPENLPLLRAVPQPQALYPEPVLTTEALEYSPVTPNMPYIIHLTSRHDFGPVFSHRYFACPPDLQQDWTEVTLERWFAVGEQFKLRAEKWDVKCPVDSKFFRLTLRPNLAMRFRVDRGTQVAF